MTSEEKIGHTIETLQRENQELRNLHTETEILSKIGSYKINLDTGAVEWTTGLREIFGLKLNDELPTTENYYDYVHPEDQEIVKKMFTDSVIKNTPFDYMYRVVLKNGIIKNVHSKSKVHTDTDGSRQMNFIISFTIPVCDVRRFIGQCYKKC